jgi:ankyrin repeat protein
MSKGWQQATRSGDIAQMRALLAAGQNINERDKHGQTALMNAARSGQEDVVRLLIDAGADLNVTAKYKLTALMLAIINAHRTIAEHLINAGADVLTRGSGAPGFRGKTALDLAEEREFKDVAEAIRRVTGDVF